MKNLKKITIQEKTTIKEALKVINAEGLKIAIITDKNNKLPKDDSSIGGITDGDINMGICSETKILVTSCMQVCCMGEDEAEFCPQCGEELVGSDGSFINDNYYCDACAQEIEAEVSDNENEILNDLYDLGVEMTNVDEMDISDYEKGLDY